MDDLTDGIHTCHDNCQRPLCVARRENERLTAENGDKPLPVDYTCADCHTYYEWDGEDIDECCCPSCGSIDTLPDPDDPDV